MKKISNINILFFFVLSSIIIKWIVLKTYFDHGIIPSVINTLSDKQYFPIIISLSNFDLSPNFVSQIESKNILSFPIYGVLIHAIFYSIFGIYSFVLLDFILKFLFYVILYRVFLEVFEDRKKSILFCLTILFTYIFFKFFSLITEINFFYYIYDSLNNNFGNRMPRPLVTGIFYFLFYLLIFRLEDKIKTKINFSYVLIIFFLLSCFLNSFFYYFINFSVLLFGLFLFYTRGKFFGVLLENGKNLFFGFIFFLIFLSPFIFQIYFGEEDYSQRLGVITINLDQKIFLTKYYLLNLLRKEPLIIILACTFIHIFINLSNLFDKRKIKKINLFFYFIIASIISPILFFFFSPKIVSIYHFLDILFFGCLFYIILNVYSLIYQNISSIFSNLNFNFVILFLFLIFISSSFQIEKKLSLKNKSERNELNKIQEFLDENDLKGSKKKLFTNDLSLMNIWLLNNNSELLVSDGFTNTLTNEQIEFNLINNLKHFKITEDKFMKIISLNENKIRDPLFLRLFTYKYQANSLHLFSKIDDYSLSLHNRIKHSSPFNAQLQIVPEDEKLRLLNLFKDHVVDQNLIADYVFINNSLFSDDLIILNDSYVSENRSQKYEIYRRKN